MPGERNWLEFKAVRDRGETLTDGDPSKSVRRDVLQAIARVMLWVSERICRANLLSELREYGDGEKSEESEREERRHGGRTERAGFSCPWPDSAFTNDGALALPITQLR